MKQPAARHHFERFLWAVSLFGLFCANPALQRARADALPEPDVEAGEINLEAVDSTRLDVARLPPEAIEVTRDLYAQGWFIEAQLGALGFFGDLGDVSRAGPRIAVSFGYELTRFLSVLAVLDLSMHDTKNREPPAHTMYEMTSGCAGLRLTAPVSHRAALWASGLVGMVWTGGDILHALGFHNTVAPSLTYGGELGFDWHVRSPHHSLGVLAGGRLYPGLDGPGFSLGTYGSTYLRYVF